VNGLCDCKDGFIGADCSTPCPERRFGKNCKRVCRCRQGALKCDNVNGACTCKPGYTGKYCQHELEPTEPPVITEPNW
jgi:hypothetical protein